MLRSQGRGFGELFEIRYLIALLPALSLPIGFGLLGAAAYLGDVLPIWASAVLGVLGIASFAGGALLLAWYADFLPSRYLYRVTKRELELRPERWVEPNNPEAAYIQVIPRENWGRVMLENASDVGLLWIDTARRQLLFEGDRQRYRIPAASIVSGCQPWNVTFAVGSPVTSTSKRWPSGPKLHAGSRFSCPMNQFVRTVITGSPRTAACQVKRCAATCPGWIGPIGESIGFVAMDTSCFETFFSSPTDKSEPCGIVYLSSSRPVSSLTEICPFLFKTTKPLSFCATIRL